VVGDAREKAEKGDALMIAACAQYDKELAEHAPAAPPGVPTNEELDAEMEALGIEAGQQ